MENNATRKALLASAASLSPFVPSDGTSPFVETKFTASKLKMNASRNVGGAAGGAGGAPPALKITEPIRLVAFPTNGKGYEFLMSGMEALRSLKAKLRGRTYVDEFGLDVLNHTTEEYRDAVMSAINTCDVVLYYENDSNLLAFVTIALKEKKILEISLLVSFDTKKGFGTKLLKAVNDIAKAAGYTSIVLKSIPGVQPFYEKSGFETAGTHNSLVLMSKPVTRRRRTNRRKGTRRQRK